MDITVKGINSEILEKLIRERCTYEDFLKQTKISKKRFERLMKGEAEATHNEMLSTAAALHLTNAEFVQCFFSR